jgi:ABC-type dipeptide/oligopeptide/nickel transport system ATPase component/ABC-type dipeptide/oligopeptide/nickel transport system permease subunit
VTITIPLEGQEDHAAKAISKHPLRRLLHNPLGVISLVILLALILVAVFAPLLAPLPPNQANVLLTNAPPGTGGYLLGGDSAGRDVLSRMIWATRGTLIACVMVLLTSGIIGVVGGLIAGYYGGRIRGVSNWISDAILALPGIVLLIALYTVIGPNITLAMAIFRVMISPVVYRLVEGVVEGVRHELYIDAAQVSGLSDLRIVFRHVLRAVRSPIIIQSAFILAGAIGLQAMLEFLGLGSPSEPSWGGMLDLSFKNIYISPTGVLWPALAITISVLTFVLLGNALRDALDPSSKRRILSSREIAKARQQLKTGDEVIPEPDPTARLSVRNLRVAYPQSNGKLQQVVRGVSFDLAPGEILGIVGESGSGKSQTSFSVLGVLPKNAVVLSGSVIYDGQDLLAQPELLRRLRGSKIAYVPQEPMSNLDPSMTIGKQMVLALRAAKPMSKTEALERIVALLGRVGIPEPELVVRKYPFQISGGMAQRVLIAGAVASDPDVIIADEPTTALDVTVQAEVLDLLRELRAERGLSMLLVTHNLGVVADLCDRVIVMKTGEIIETAQVTNFFDGPAHSYSKSLLAAAGELE